MPSSTETELGRTGLEFQVAGGIDYALRDNVSIIAKCAGYAPAVSTITASSGHKSGHDPVRSDGVTPFTSDFMVCGASRWGMAAGLGYSL